MLDIKVLRQEPERIKEALKKRFNPLDIEEERKSRYYMDILAY